MATAAAVPSTLTSDPKRGPLAGVSFSTCSGASTPACIGVTKAHAANINMENRRQLNFGTFMWPLNQFYAHKPTLHCERKVAPLLYR